MAVPGLTLPHLSAADPDTQGEGSINPLGLAVLADHLAGEIAGKAVTARMSRIRWLTAIAVGARVTADLRDFECADGITPEYIAFEWLVIEGFARRSGTLPESARRQVPGIEKAGAVLAADWGGHLDARSYLKTPRVFGFSGVFRTLAVGIEVIDDEGLLLPRGEELVGIWEREQNLRGFLDRSRGSEGAAFAAKLERATRDALLAGRVTQGMSSHLWRPLVERLRPDDAGRRERKLIWGWLINADDPGGASRRETLRAMIRYLRADREEPASEREWLKALSEDPEASDELQLRIEAIDAFEGVASLLFEVFDHLRYLSTARGTEPVEIQGLSDDPVLISAARDLPTAWARAQRLLEPLDLDLAFVEELGEFADPLAPCDLAEQVLAHHVGVQGRKLKRSWFAQLAEGVVVRPGYSLDEPSGNGGADGERRPLSDEFVHPYRISALRRFIADLNAEKLPQ